MEAMMIVAILRLNKDGRVGETLGIDFTTHIIKMDAFANVTSCILNCRISIDI